MSKDEIEISKSGRVKACMFGKDIEQLYFPGIEEGSLVYCKKDDKLYPILIVQVLSAYMQNDIPSLHVLFLKEMNQHIGNISLKGDKMLIVSHSSVVKWDKFNPAIITDIIKNK